MRKIINIVLVMTLLAGLCIPAFAAGKTFADVPTGNWAHPFIQRAADQGWVSGVGGDRYEPNKTVTYSQFAVMLGKALYPDDFAAQPAGAQWWTPACEVADKHGLFKDTDMAHRSDWNAVANTPIKREHMAQMMYNALVDVGAKLPTYEEYTEVSLHINDIIDCENDEAVAVCYTLKLLSGNGNGFFNPRDPMTRAQAAVVLCRMYDAVQGSSSDPEVNQPDIPSTDTVTITPFHRSGPADGGNAYTTFGLHVVAPSSARLRFTIAPSEAYAAVIMPDDNTAVIEGTGDATFKEIRFTEPGTYSFMIYEEEGMDHYRYDGREWELTVTVTGTAGAPAGAVGGQYDTSVYDVPADSNKDGWITEAEVQAVLAQLRIDYPEGSHWGSDSRWNSSVFGPGRECAGFAFMVSDKIFGNLPKYEISMESTRVGDVLFNGPENHKNVVLNDYGKDMFEGVNYTDSYTTANGNASGETVRWDMVEYYADWPTGTSGTHIYSRYPAGTNTPSTLELGTVTYKRGETTSTDGASFITTCLDTPTWSSETKEKARKIMADMTLEEKVGQLFLLHYPGDGSGTVAQATDLINKYHPGGYLVFSAMFEGNTTAGVQKKIADTQAASDIPLLFTVDEEGGLASSGRRIVRISDKSQYGHDPFLSPQELKTAGGLAAVAADTIDKASFLKNLGLNVNHAPVADVSAPGGMMYNRTWGGTALENAEYVETLVGAAAGTGVGTTMKHFPGYGATSADTHNGFAINDLTWDDFIYGDLLPFHAGIGAGGRAVMVTHNTINCLDGRKPATAL